MSAKPYIGPERRKGERRGTALGPIPLRYDWLTMRTERFELRRKERRQEGLSGVIAGMSAEQMLLLRKLHEKYDSLGPIGKAAMNAKPNLTYDQIVAREA